MANSNASEIFYGSRREPQWLVESPKEAQSHFDRRGCVRQIRTSEYRSSSSVHTPGSNLPSRSSYPLDQPPMVSSADRQAYVHNAVPAIHGIHVDRPAFTIVNNVPIVEFMVPLCCGRCEEQVKEELENVKGVYKVVCDQHNQKVTVSSTVDPERLLKRIKRVKKNSHFWSGNSYLKNVRHVTPNLPSDVHSHHSPVVHRSDMAPAYELEPAHHRMITAGISSRNQRSSYDSVGTRYQMSKSVAPQAEDADFYYPRAEHRYMSPDYTSSATPYISTRMDTSLDHNYGHFPASYGPAYEYYEDYALSSSGYY